MNTTLTISLPEKVVYRLRETKAVSRSILVALELLAAYEVYIASGRRGKFEFDVRYPRRRKDVSNEGRKRPVSKRGLCKMPVEKPVSEEGVVFGNLRLVNGVWVPLQEARHS